MNFGGPSPYPRDIARLFTCTSPDHNYPPAPTVPAIQFKMDIFFTNIDFSKVVEIDSGALFPGNL